MVKGKELRLRRYWIFVIILLLLVLLLGWRFYTRQLRIEHRLLRAAPPTSGLIAAWPQAAAFLQVADTLGATLEVLPAGLQRDLALYRDLFQRMDSTGFSMDQPLLFFLQPNGPEGPALGAIWAMRGAAAIRGELPATAVAQTQYRGQPVLTATWEGGARLTFTQYGRLLVMGRFPFLVEEVIGHLSGNPGSATLGGAAAALTSAPLTLWMNEEMLNRNWPGPENFWPPGWLRIGVKAGGGARKLQGQFFTASGAPLPWMEDAEAANPGSILNVIPEEFRYLEWRHFEAPGQGLGTGVLADFFRPVAGREQVYAANPSGAGDRGEALFWLLSVEDRARTDNLLDSLARQVGTLEDYTYQTYRIRRLLTGALRPGRGGKGFESPYCVLLGDYLLLANSRSGVELWIDQFLAEATLVRSPAFLEFYQGNDEPASTWWMARPPLRNPSSGEAPLREAFFHLIAKEAFIGVRWSGEATKPDLEITWSKGAETPSPGSRIAWQFRLAAEARTAPQPLPGGEAGAPFFVVQDDNYQVYLLDAAGRERWRKPLESPVQSAFHLIDYYRDGQQQLLFNTPVAIHLLDLEKGEETGLFPLPLNPPATNALTVVDTSGHGGYAFFVAKSNGHLYGLDREGRPLPGWNPRFVGAEVDYPLLHFQESTRDFFVALDTAGTLHVFKRDGTYRFPPLVFQDTFPNPPDYQLHPGASRIVTCNQDGVVYVTNLAGEHFRLRLETRPRRPVHFAFADIVGDDRNDYITLNRGRISVHYYRGNTFGKAFNFQNDRPLSDVFAVSLPGQDKAAVGAVDAAAGKIYLVDGKGNLFPGFPLAGRTRFSVLAPPAGGAPLLVVADGRTVYGYEVVGGDWSLSN